MTSLVQRMGRGARDFSKETLAIVLVDMALLPPDHRPPQKRKRTVKTTQSDGRKQAKTEANSVPVGDDENIGSGDDEDEEDDSDTDVDVDVVLEADIFNPTQADLQEPLKDTAASEPSKTPRGKAKRGRVLVEIPDDLLGFITPRGAVNYTPLCRVVQYNAIYGNDKLGMCYLL
jgi:hypothetical protein